MHADIFALLGQTVYPASALAVATTDKQVHALVRAAMEGLGDPVIVTMMADISTIWWAGAMPPKRAPWKAAMASSVAGASTLFQRRTPKKVQ